MSASSGAGAAGWVAGRVRNSGTSGKVDSGRLAAVAAVGESPAGGCPRSPDERGTRSPSASRCTADGGAVIGSLDGPVDRLLGGFGDALAAVSTGTAAAVGGASFSAAAR